MMDLQAIKEMLCKELKVYETRSKLNLADLDAIHKLTDTIKNIDKIELLEEEESEYSSARRRRDSRGRYSREGGGGYSRGESYESGESYARGGRGGSNYSRDGGYSREGGGYSREGGGYSRDGYSRDGGSERVMEMMEEMMENASPEERKTIERMMQAARK